MDMDTDIRAAIDKNLPTQLAGALRERIDLVESLEKKNAQLSAQLNTAQLTVKERDNTISRKESLISRHEEIGTREKLVAEREKQIEIRELKQDLAAEKRISAFATDTVSKLVRNTEFRSTVLHSEGGSVPVMTPSGYPQTFSSSNSSTKTTTDEVV